jgi:hypothetical protein
MLLAERFFKFLGADSIGRFSDFAWPPSGEWVRVDGPLDPCVSGIHVCRTGDLPYWFDDELWEVDVAGERLEHLEQLVVERARLVSRVEAWPDPLASQLAAGCVRELRRFTTRELELSEDPDATELAAGEDLEAARVAAGLASRDRPTSTASVTRLLALFADAGEIAAAPSTGTATACRYIAYIAAHAADHATPERRLPPGATGFSEERRRQADELARVLES